MPLAGLGICLAFLSCFVRQDRSGWLSPRPRRRTSAEAPGQGLSAAMMFATTMALLSNSYSGRDRGVAFGTWGAVNGAAAAAGPILGGLLATHFGWRWIFYVNLPVSVIAVAMTAWVITESSDPAARRVDLPGMVTFTAAAGCLTYALIRGGWTSAATLRLLAGAVVALALFVVAELKRPDPMLDLSLLRNRAFSALLVAGALMSAAAWAAMAYESLWLQSLLGKSAIGAGLVLLPAALMAFVVRTDCGRDCSTGRGRRRGGASCFDSKDAGPAGVIRTCPAAVSAGPAIGPGGGDDEDDRAGEEVTVGRLPLQGPPPVAGLGGGQERGPRRAGRRGCEP